VCGSACVCGCAVCVGAQCVWVSVCEVNKQINKQITAVHIAPANA
jgi:hypothetical protein